MQHSNGHTSTSRKGSFGVWAKVSPIEKNKTLKKNKTIYFFGIKLSEIEIFRLIKFSDATTNHFTSFYIILFVAAVVPIRVPFETVLIIP